MKRIKYVQRANAWCVSWSEKDPKSGKIHQHIQWFDSEEEAKKFIEQ